MVLGVLNQVCDVFPRIVTVFKPVSRDHQRYSPLFTHSTVEKIPYFELDHTMLDGYDLTTRGESTDVHISLSIIILIKLLF